MNHYDDLQRFKDKTHTQNLTFKDLSGQSSVAERGDWAIMNQLVPSADEKKTLGTGGSVAHAIPQPVSGTTFAFHLQPEVPPQPAPEQRAAPPVTASTAAEAPMPHAPLPPPARTSRPPVADPVNYARLFAAQNAPVADKTENQAKDLPLKSLLERIASCR